jgi:signal transduction histidine kinase
MLQYGLTFALEDCVDELSTRSEDGASISLDVPQSDARYAPKVEEHIYRIVQQACENALRHAHAEQIRIYGRLESSQVHLTIEDDGIGFSQKMLDFNSLLREKHFGLAGMFERADLISADLKFESVPGEGTKIIISWSPENKKG